jgi:hypothetical protein
MPLAPLTMAVSISGRLFALPLKHRSPEPPPTAASLLLAHLGRGADVPSARGMNRPTPPVVHPDQEGPQRRPDHGQRAGIGRIRWPGQVQSQAIGDNGADDISVRADEI